jgi:epoxyqueuosine reductase
LRNAAVAAGNSGDSSLVEPLKVLLLGSKYPIVRGHAAWALGRYQTVAALQALDAAMATETDSEVVSEITLAQAEQRNFHADQCEV